VHAEVAAVAAQVRGIDLSTQRIEQTVGTVLTNTSRGGVVMASLDALKAQVDANTTLEGSAVTLIQGIAAQLQAALAGNDPAKVQALVDELQASAAPLAAAIAANTPAAPTP